jgi:hypothetical protein
MQVFKYRPMRIMHRILISSCNINNINISININYLKINHMKKEIKIKIKIKFKRRSLMTLKEKMNRTNKKKNSIIEQILKCPPTNKL